MRRYILLLVSLVVSLHAFAQKKPVADKVIAIVPEQPDVLGSLNIKPQATASRGLLTALAGTSVSLAANGIKQLIEKDKAKYTAEHFASTDQLYFYSKVSTQSPLDPEGLQFNGIKVIRLVETKSNSYDTAFVLSLALDLDNPYDIINNSVFRLKLNDFKFYSPKCKVPEMKAGQNLNLDVEIKIRSSWMTEQGVFCNNIELGKFILLLRNVPLDKPRQREMVASLAKDPVKSKLDGYCMMVPRSFGYYKSSNGNFQPCWGQGIYSVDVSIRESSKQRLVVKLLQDNSNDISNGIRQIRVN